MNTYLIIKWVHILSSVLLVGTGFGSAVHMFLANRSGSLEAKAVMARQVVKADWWFTSPAVIVQPLSGIWMAHLAGWPLSTPWLLASIALYAVAGLCWLPVVWIQIRMAALAEQAVRTGQALSPRYESYRRLWEALGYPAFVAMLAIFYLMVNKPALWA